MLQTDENGAYSLDVKNGTYNVSLVVLNTAWEVCQNYNVAFTESDTMQLDFATRSTVETVLFWSLMFLQLF